MGDGGGCEGSPACARRRTQHPTAVAARIAAGATPPFSSRRGSPQAAEGASGLIRYQLAKRRTGQPRASVLTGSFVFRGTSPSLDVFTSSRSWRAMIDIACPPARCLSGLVPGWGVGVALSSLLPRAGRGPSRLHAAHRRPRATLLVGTRSPLHPGPAPVGDPGAQPPQRHGVGMQTSLVFELDRRPRPRRARSPANSSGSPRRDQSRRRDCDNDFVCLWRCCSHRRSAGGGRLQWRHGVSSWLEQSLLVAVDVDICLQSVKRGLAKPYWGEIQSIAIIRGHMEIKACSIAA